MTLAVLHLPDCSGGYMAASDMRDFVRKYAAYSLAAPIVEKTIEYDDSAARQRRSIDCVQVKDFHGETVRASLRIQLVDEFIEDLQRHRVFTTADMLRNFYRAPKFALQCQGHLTRN